LDPTLPTDRPLSKRERFAAKFGAARFDQMEKMMAERFKQEGLSLTYDGTVRQTTLSQRLIAQAYAVGGEEMQMKTVEAIYRKYFSEGKDIGDVAVLVPVSVENGVFEAEEAARAWLEGTQGIEEYNAGVLAAQKAGISGVPFFRCAKSSFIYRLFIFSTFGSESMTSGVYLVPRTRMCLLRWVILQNSFFGGTRLTSLCKVFERIANGEMV
jgi:predicted DsbA family dithiol-disulfide isomerase